jgi:UDP-N-acetylmuramoyl-tripeptide--D-alanyl-D-alanine ligase
MVEKVDLTMMRDNSGVSGVTRSIAHFKLVDIQNALPECEIYGIFQGACPIVTDSRELQTGDAFLPLVGERFDGHTFLSHLPEGVEVVFYTPARISPEVLHSLQQRGMCLIAVPDTLKAYQALAAYHRSRCSNTTFIALTGSSGKTTVKEYLLHGFSAFGPTQATEQNYNNDIGVARTVLGISLDTHFAIVEMGMRGLGEIQRLTQFVKPDVGLLINAGLAHLERLGTPENIARAKCELVEGIQHILVSNADSPRLQDRLNELSDRIESLQHLRYGLSQVTTLTVLTDGTYRFQYEGIEFCTRVPGEHHVSNLLGVIAVASALGLNLSKLAKQMALFTPGLGRFERVPLPKHHTLINDAYNANPESMHASLDALLTTPLPNGVHGRFLILGSMKELGPDVAIYHQQLMDYLIQNPHASIKGVAFIGSEFTSLTVQITEHTQALLIYTFENTTSFISMLPKLCARILYPMEWYLKGSRFHALEMCIDPLKQALQQQKCLVSNALDDA